MSKTLIVVRHGHAVEGEDDFTRRLSDRGVSEVNTAGARLAERGVCPDALVTSSAPRAAETARLLAKQCAFAGTIRQVEVLYLAEPSIVLNQVCATDDRVETLLVVGHNPGLSSFVENLSGKPCEMATAQVVHLQLDVNQWSEVSFV